MANYSEIPAADGAFARWVREEDPPADLYDPALGFAAVKSAVEALDRDVRVHETVHPTVEHSALALAAKVTRLVSGFLHAQMNVYLSRFGRVGLLEWEWRRQGEKGDPGRGAALPGGGERVEALARRLHDLLTLAGIALIPLEEARRVVRVADDPLYTGEYYEITVFEALFGMGYPESQH